MKKISAELAKRLGVPREMSEAKLHLLCSELRRKRVAKQKPKAKKINQNKKPSIWDL